MRRRFDAVIRICGRCSKAARFSIFEDRFDRRHDVPLHHAEGAEAVSLQGALKVAELVLAQREIVDEVSGGTTARVAHQCDFVFRDAFHSEGVLLKLEQFVAQGNESFGR